MACNFSTSLTPVIYFFGAFTFLLVVFFSRPGVDSDENSYSKVSANRREQQQLKLMVQELDSNVSIYDRNIIIFTLLLICALKVTFKKKV